MQEMDRFQKLFRGRETAYGQYLDHENPDQKEIRTIRDQPPVDAWARHLKGEGPGLGIVPIRLDETCYFGAVDLDDTNADHTGLAKKAAALEIPLVVCRSKSGGAHLYLFLADPAPAKLVHDKLKSWASALGLSNEDARPIEIFPKQTALGRDAVGNWINLPYYGGGSGDTNRYAVTQEGEFLDLTHFLALAERKRIGSDELRAWAVGSPDEETPFESGPPCLQTLHVAGYPKGSRNTGLYNVGIYFKMAHPDTWQEEVRSYNEEYMDPPLSDREVDTVLGSISKRDYTYKGQEPPLYDHCCQGGSPHLKQTCSRRKYGVNAGKRNEAHAALPPIGQITQIDSDPPIYHIEIGDEKVRVEGEKWILNFRDFRRLVARKTRRVPPMMKDSDWVSVIDPILAEAEVIPPPEDATLRGVFLSLVREFLEYRQSAKSREDLYRGLPYEEDGRIYFRFPDLQKHLDELRFRHFSPEDCFDYLRLQGGKSMALEVEGEKNPVRVWSVPAELADTEQENEFSPKNEDPDF